MLRDEGVVHTTTEVSRYVKRQCRGLVEGLPGYYSVQLYRLKRQYGSIDPVRPIQVSPDEIRFLTGTYERRDKGHLDYVPHFKPQEATWDYLPYAEEVPYGSVRDGDWDQTNSKFDDLLMFKGATQRFDEGIEWVDTIYYRELVEQFQEQDWTPAEAADLAMSRCRSLDQLYDSVASVGYQSQQELRGSPLHEVTVTIGRDGELRYNCEGRHRLTIAKLLGVDSIPVLVLTTHKQFAGEPSDVGL